MQIGESQHNTNFIIDETCLPYINVQSEDKNNMLCNKND